MKDSCAWLRNTPTFGADKDEVLRRSNGFYTYYAVDIAYHRNKFIERRFDRVIDVWGADHHGHAIRLAATMRAPALGLLRDASSTSSSCRWCLDARRRDRQGLQAHGQGGALARRPQRTRSCVDACRFFFNALPDTHLEPRPDLAVRCDKKPCLLRPVCARAHLHAAGYSDNGCTVVCRCGCRRSAASTPQEREPSSSSPGSREEIHLAARDYDPSRINRYVTELAARFTASTMSAASRTQSSPRARRPPEAGRRATRCARDRYLASSA